MFAKDVEMKDKCIKELEYRLESTRCSRDVHPNCSTCIVFKDKSSWVRGQVHKLMAKNEYLLSLVEKCSKGKGKMHLILAKTKMFADKT